ncbi:hypothetical protein [Phascolarctobacterium succinatutens]|uniref:hypothetical protein n=1 Tax=Phascolarctobacterium succinatutens TaxID=626940 RepID=UPI0026EA638D|nr:hypothetical protein [Phascolarctobacterium succinatutens]
MGFLSGLIGTAVSTLAGHWSAKQNAKIARDQWAYQQSNAHQLEVQDLRNAGLNPILSASNSQIASMPQVSDNGVSGASANLLSSTIQAASAKELKRMDLENELLKTKVDAAKNGITVKDDGSIERAAADERFSAGTENLKADTAEKTSAKDVNEANVGYIKQQTVSLKDITQAQVAQIKQDIQNSIDQTKALVEKYGAESQQARASAALAYKQIETEASKAALYLSQKTNTDWDTNRVIKELSDPDSNLHRDYRNTPVGTLLGYLGEAIKDVTPFRFALGVRK